jgi:hypothetical protein
MRTASRATTRSSRSSTPRAASSTARTSAAAATTRPRPVPAGRLRREAQRRRALARVRHLPRGREGRHQRRCRRRPRRRGVRHGHDPLVRLPHAPCAAATARDGVRAAARRLVPRRVRRQAAAKRPGARLWHLPRRQADRGRRRHRRGSRRQRVPRGLDAIAGLPGHPGAATADRQPLVLDHRPARGALQRRVRDEAQRRRAAVALQHLPRRQRRGPGPRDRRRPRWAAHVAGSTDSRTLGIAAPVQATLGGGIDAHLAVIAPTGALRANAAPSTRAAASMWRVARFRRTCRSLRRCRAYLRATATCSR